MVYLRVLTVKNQDSRAGRTAVSVQNENILNKTLESLSLWFSEHWNNGLWEIGTFSCCEKGPVRLSGYQRRDLSPERASTQF